MGAELLFTARCLDHLIIFDGNPLPFTPKKKTWRPCFAVFTKPASYGRNAKPDNILIDKLSMGAVFLVGFVPGIVETREGEVEGLTNIQDWLSKIR